MNKKIKNIPLKELNNMKKKRILKNCSSLNSEANNVCKIFFSFLFPLNI